MHFPFLKKQVASPFSPTLLILLAIWILGLFIRFYSISGHSINMWYDQTRDLQTVREMITNRDLKIQGPSASGTNDTIYHGVFYYYLIAPAVWIGQGSPVVVSYYLATIGSTSILIAYALIRTVFRSRAAGLVTAFFFAIGLVPTHYSTWLSNPHILLPATGAFYYFLGKICYDKAARWEYIGLGLTLGLAIHGGIFQLYLLGPLALALLHKTWHAKRGQTLPVIDLGIAIATFLLTISPIILTHLLLIKRGILTPETLQMMSSTPLALTQVLGGTVELYAKTMHTILTPGSAALVFILVATTALASWSKLTAHQRTWSAIVITAPLWLLLVQFRTSSHMLIGIEYLVYGLVALTLTSWWRQHLLGKLLTMFIMLLIIIPNISMIANWKAHQHHYGVIQKGTSLKEQLAAIDATYLEAAGAPFSISTLTSPYNINITWGYLYDWYGKQKYGYLPTFVGSAQVGVIGASLLPHAEQARPVHFTFFEPDTALPAAIIENFTHAQDQLISTPSAEYSFGSLRVQRRHYANN